VFGQDDQLNKTVEVTPRRGGVLISVTDELRYGMFEIGSAVPQRQLVLAMEKIAQSLDSRSGKVVIMGHTDGRPFRSADYDNWRLSTARAHAAYYMLVRGGLQEARVTEIAGFADRMLKVADDPLDDSNRRIEIFLEVE
jgi:chemotaxis protein MotB